MNPALPDRSWLLGWLRETDPDRLAELLREADRVRRERVGDAVWIRGLIEFSSHCRRECLYCGLRRGNAGLPRYRMPPGETAEAAAEAVSAGCGTIVLQSGEDPANTSETVVGLVRRVKAAAPEAALTLSLGSRPARTYEQWRRAGADRYLLRFETSDPVLFRRLHSHGSGLANHRIACLLSLRALGYEVGSGIMVGLPGQTWETVADDLIMFARLDLDMVGLGPFIRHPGTPLADPGSGPDAPPGEQVPATLESALKVLALARLVCPSANIPATSALSALDPQAGLERGLSAGANVVMANFTPPGRRDGYQIYPGKTRVSGIARHREYARRIEMLGRTVGVGRGPSPTMAERNRKEAPQ